MIRVVVALVREAYRDPVPGKRPHSRAAQHLISPMIPIQPFVKPAFVQGGLLPVSP